MNKITTVIIHHENHNQHYLDWCLKSLSLQEGVDNETIIVVTSPEDPDVKNLPSAKLMRVDRSFGPEKALNYGVKHARPQSDFIMLLNDDTILSRPALRVLSDTIGDHPKLILNAWSNCDMGWLFFGAPEITHPETGKKLKVSKQMRFDDVKGFEQAIIDLPRFKGNPMIPAEFNCFYATMMRRELFNAVGGNDERFHCGQSDQYFCMQAKKLQDARCLVTFETFIWHYGGVTVENMTDQERQKKQEVFQQILRQDGWIK